MGITTENLETTETGSILIMESNNSPVYENSWVDYHVAWKPVKYWKDCYGIVHIEGMMKNGTMLVSAFTLPDGYRPAGRIAFYSESANADGRVDVLTDGTVVPYGGTNGWINFNVMFRPA